MFLHKEQIRHVFYLSSIHFAPLCYLVSAPAARRALTTPSAPRPAALLPGVSSCSQKSPGHALGSQNGCSPTWRLLLQPEEPCPRPRLPGQLLSYLASAPAARRALATPS
ncbi:MAG: hypothetical protein ACK53Y_08965, partial [bacterium]